MSSSARGSGETSRANSIEADRQRAEAKRTARATTNQKPIPGTSSPGPIRTKAPARNQRQVSEVEYSSFNEAREELGSPGGGEPSGGIRRQAPIKKPLRTGARSMDQSNTSQRSQAAVSRPTKVQQHGSQEVTNMSKSTAGQKSSHQAGNEQGSSSSGQAQLSLMTTPEQADTLDNSVLVETADDEELVTDNSQAGLPGGFPSSLTAGLTKNLIWAVFASTVGSSFQHGYNGGVVNAPEKLIGEFVNATYFKRHGEGATETQIDFIVALIVSIFCIGGCLGALMTALVADRMGRKEGLMYNNIIVLIAAPMMASSKAASSYELLIAGRFLIGINAGLNAGLAPLYLNEIAPIKLRGALGTIYQLVITISILLSNIFGLPSLLGDAASWPLLFVIPIIPAAFMLIALPHCCESPKHLILNQGRELQAQQALAWLRETGDVMEEMDELRSERELQTLQQRSISLGDMLSDTSLRKPLTIAVVIMLSQQFSGINAVLFYSTSIFRDAGLGEQAAVRATLGMSVVNVAMTLVSLFLVDRAGRRTLHMTGLMGMAATCLVLAFCLTGNGALDIQQQQDGASGTSGLAVVAVYVFIAMFASGPGAIPWFLVAELFPSNARPLATSIAVAVNWLANFTVSMCFLPLTNVLHGFTFVLFAILLVIFYLFTYYKVPETKGATAEEISALFRR